MDLTFDLSLERRVPPSNDPAARVLGLEDLAVLARRPRDVARLLWARRYDRVVALDEPLPLSAIRAGGLALAALARSAQLVVDTGHAERRPRRAAVLARAARDLVRATCNELLRAPLIERRARRVAAARVTLPERAREARSCTYIRSDASMRYRGAYVGGAAAHTSGVVNGLTANGVAVTVYAAERPLGVEVPFHAVPMRRAYHLAPWLTPVDHAADLVAAAGPRRTDFVYERYALGSHAGLALARAWGVPLVLEFNGSEVWIGRNWAPRGIRGAGILQRIEDRNLSDASLVVVVSSALRDALVDHGVDERKVVVNPNGVDVDRLERLRSRPPARWRSQLGLPEAPTVGFIGSFGPWHGVLTLPETIARLADARPDARWLLIGDGPLGGELRAELTRRGLGERVELAGVVDHERALPLLAACDVCVSPHVPNPDGSRFFGSPTKLFEYMGLAKPIVASDLEQIGEVLDDGETGLLCEPGDSEAAAAAIARLLGDEPLRRRLGDAALQAARRDHTWEAHVRRILERLEAGAPAAAAARPLGERA